MESTVPEIQSTSNKYTGRTIEINGDILIHEWQCHLIDATETHRIWTTRTIDEFAESFVSVHLRLPGLAFALLGSPFSTVGGPFSVVYRATAIGRISGCDHVPGVKTVCDVERVRIIGKMWRDFKTETYDAERIESYFLDRLKELNDEPGLSDLERERIKASLLLRRNRW